ncbi:hypothetical protein Tco_0162542, partial [Tanacetum coccineum]
LELVRGFGIVLFFELGSSSVVFGTAPSDLRSFTVCIWLPFIATPQLVSQPHLFHCCYLFLQALPRGSHRQFYALKLVSYSTWFCFDFKSAFGADKAVASLFGVLVLHSWLL